MRHSDSSELKRKVMDCYQIHILSNVCGSYIQCSCLKQIKFITLKIFQWEMLSLAKSKLNWIVSESLCGEGFYLYFEKCIHTCFKSASSGYHTLASSHRYWSSGFVVNQFSPVNTPISQLYARAPRLSACLTSRNEDVSKLLENVIKVYHQKDLASNCWYQFADLWTLLVIKAMSKSRFSSQMSINVTL